MDFPHFTHHISKLMMMVNKPPHAEIKAHKLQKVSITCPQ